MDTLLQAQTAGSRGDEKFYAGEWEVALEQYTLAIRLFNQALTESSQRENDPMMAKLLSRYKDMCEQIQEYIEASNSINLSNDLSSSSQMTDVTGTYDDNHMEKSLPNFSVISQPTAINTNVQISIEQDPGDVNGYPDFIWNGLEQLLTLLPSPRAVKKLIPRFSTPDEPDSSSNLETSFILVPRSEESVNLEESVKLPPECIGHIAEIQKLKAANEALQAQNANLMKMVNNRTGIQDLLQENVLLKNSISNFRFQVMKQSQLWRQSQLLSTRTPFTPSFVHSRHTEPSSTRDKELEHLRQLLREKDEEIKKLEKIKEKYEGAKQEALKKRKEKKFQTDSGFTVSPSASSSST